MKKIASFVLVFTFMFVTSQLAFSDDEYTFAKITEDEFEKAFDYKINCFDEPSKEPRFFPFEFKRSLTSGEF